jgi:hypothetical protein
MERGVYFDAWFPWQHNYHPSLPPRRLRMIEHLEEYRATILVWAALGGGNISLPYLEEEAFGEVPARYRVYGFVNDAEFIEECGRRGIKVFGVIFEHAWEYPVELNDDEDTVLALNETRGAGTRDWLGMREFWQDRYPKLWPPRAKYFPDPVLNAWGEPVDDILEECAQRDIHGAPCHALWIECSDREHWNYMMDRNNPVWREYLKAIVRLQIDAGVQGIHFDEAEVPITSLQYGGCFCRTCVEGFREYLAELPDEEKPAELENVELAKFDYGRWLLGQGHDFKSNREQAPLFFDYLRFQRRNIAGYFAELADYAKEYATSVGREVLVSGNFFHLFDHYYALEPKVDVIVTEMRNTTYRQPDWYRYAAGFASGKPVVVVENPYGGVVPEMVEALKVGRGLDRFRQSLLEAAALGVNMSVPYGAWMGSVIQDAFYAPHEVTVEIQTFLADHEELFTPETLHEVGVVFSIESNYRALAAREVMADNRTNELPEEQVPFGVVCEGLSEVAVPYDVVFFPDGDLRQDSITAAELIRYRTLVLPQCSYLTAPQTEALLGYLDGGGRAVIVGPFAENLSEQQRERLRSHPGTATTEPRAFTEDALDGGPQVRVEGRAIDLACTIRRVGDRAALHWIRYDHDEEADRVPVLDELRLSVRLPFQPRSAEALSPSGSPTASIEDDSLVIHDVPLAGVVVLAP